MNKSKLYAVITGDIVRSRSLDEAERAKVLEVIKQIHRQTPELPDDAGVIHSFEIFRGDSFQGLLTRPEQVLNVAILLRASVRRCLKKKQQKLPDVRMAMSIGTIDGIPERISEGNGEAYQWSGKLLDEGGNDRNLAIVTPWAGLDRALNASCGLLDLIVGNWTHAQADIIPETMFRHTQTEIAGKRNLSQEAIHNRLKTAGWHPVSRYLTYVKNRLQDTLANHNPSEDD